MSSGNETVAVGMNLEFFDAEDSSGQGSGSGNLDLQKYRTALDGYVETLEEIGSVNRDDRFDEFISVSQQILGRLEGDEKEKAIRLLNWDKENSGFSAVVT